MAQKYTEKKQRNRFRYRQYLSSLPFITRTIHTRQPLKKYQHIRRTNQKGKIYICIFIFQLISHIKRNPYLKTLKLII
jgi:hypothetical protein